MKQELIKRKQKALNDFIVAFEKFGEGLKEAKQAATDLAEALEKWKLTKNK